jgi:hypothetical protein
MPAVVWGAADTLAPRRICGSVDGFGDPGLAPIHVSILKRPVATRAQGTKAGNWTGLLHPEYRRPPEPEPTV